MLTVLFYELGVEVETECLQDVLESGLLNFMFNHIFLKLISTRKKRWPLKDVLWWFAFILFSTKKTINVV